MSEQPSDQKPNPEAPSKPSDQKPNPEAPSKLPQPIKKIKKISVKKIKKVYNWAKVF